MKKALSFILAVIVFSSIVCVRAEDATDYRAIAEKVNDYWIKGHSTPPGYSWDEAAYYTGDMEIYYLTGDEAYREYAEKWADKNAWRGAGGNDRVAWNNSNVYFADNQTCFQVYIDLYNSEGGEEKIARALEVTGAQMEEETDSFWWWCDALYMAMPVYSKLYVLTGDKSYLSALYKYYSYTKNRLYDKEEHLFFRDSGYIGSRIDGQKNIWARGTGWVMAALAKTLQDVPEDCEGYDDYLTTFREMAEACRKYAKTDGDGRRFLTQSVIPNYPLSDTNPYGYETSGTSFVAYAIWWGINSGVLDEDYLPLAEGMLRYITEIAVQESGRVRYVQPIGAAATKATSETDCYNFGVGAVISALCEAERYYNGAQGDVLPYLEKKTLGSAAFKIGSGNVYSGGEVKPLDGAPYISDGNTMVPARAVAEALGSEVTWNEKEQAVIISLNGRSTKFYVGETAEIRENRAYIPIRAAAEALGKKVYWNDNEKMVVIGPRENVFYGCDSTLVKILSEILESGALPERPEQKARDFSLHVPEFKSDKRIRIASASAAEVEPENGARNAFDDNLDSRWAGINEPDIVFDIGSVQHVEKIAVSFWQYDTRTTKYELEVSKDGVEYDTVFDGSSKIGEIFNYTDIGQNVRYIRLVGHGNSNNGWTSVLEVVPMGK